MKRLLAALLGLAVAVTLAGCPAPRQAPVPPGLALPTRPAPGPPPTLDGRSNPVADPVYPAYGNPAIDVLRYQLDLAWDPAGRQLSGTATLTVRPVRPLTEITLDFASGYTVDSATVDGAAVTASRAPTGDVLVRLAHETAAESRLTVAVAYHGRPAPVAFPGNRADVDDLGMHVTADGALWTMQEPYGAFTWYPCSDQPSDEALYDFAVTVPDGFAAVANGTPAAPADAGGGRHTYRWHAPEPIATYLVTLAVDRFQRFDDVGPDGLPITYWLRAAQVDDMLPVLRQTPAMLRWLSARLGRYPFSSAGVVIVAGESGMETQTMITIGPIGRSSAPVLLHELAHHWFGDAVTPTTWRDVWLNEGFATYLQMMYTVDALGGDQKSLLAGWRTADTVSRIEAGPPGHARADRFAARNVYLGPALMLHEIRGQLGDAAFLAMLHDWVQHHLHTQQTRASFTSWLTAYTGKDLTALLDRWLDSTTTPP